MADRSERGWPPGSPLFQPPNPPLLVAQAGFVLTWVTRGPVRLAAHVVALAGLAAWAWLELADGVNWIRRLYGVAGLAYVGARIGFALGRRGR